MKKFDYYQPESLKEAYGLMEKLNGEARFIAGGTDVIVRIKQGALHPDALISLRRISALKGLGNEDGLSMGSMTLFRDIERDPAIARDYPALGEAASVLANPQVRNVATIGGNLCNAAPSADAAPPLMVLEATLTIEGPGGQREVSIEDFFRGPGETCLEHTEVVTRITIPKKRKGTGMAFLKIGRVAQDIAIANAAALIVVENGVCRKCRLSAGAVAPVPLRLKRIEGIVEGRKIEPDLLDRVAEMVQEDVSPITDVRSTAQYRKTVSGILVKRAIKEALDRAG